MEFKPHDYQQYTIGRIIHSKKVFAILEMGLGKTVCTLTAINELIYNRFETERVLVIAPLRVADSTWGTEAEKWDHLHRLTVSKVLGTEKQRIAGLEATADIYCVNRENVKWLVDYFVKKKKWPFDMVVVDESSSFKNHTSQRFKALKKVTRITDRIVLLTGTPDPNGLMELWPQLFLLDAGERLGTTLTAYRDRWFKPGRRNGNIIYEYVPKHGAKEEIYKAIGDITVSLSAKDHLRMPERIDNVVKLKMPDAARQAYEQMELESVLQLERGEIVAGSKAVVANKLLQMANGAVYYEEITENAPGEFQTIRRVERIHDTKLDALEEIIEDNAGQTMLVYYNYKHDYDRLMERFAKYNPESIRSDEDIKRWNAGKVRLMLAHPASMGHGLNLQAGGSNIVWFGMPWSLELYQQANARLYRQGQAQTVVITHLVIEDSADEDVLESLQRKRVNQDELIAAVKARIEKRKTMRV